jgi:FtsZ-binding cell division protein ZapB
MSEFAWDTEVAKEPESGPQQEVEIEFEPESEPEPEPEEKAQAPAPGALTLSANDFSALEERIMRAVEVVRRERLARAEAEERAAQAETQLRVQAALVEQLEKDAHALRTEREHVRERVERLLGQLDALEL